jgi:alpha-glucosidase
MKRKTQSQHIPHHDGSELYVSNIAPTIGDTVRLRVRIPNQFAFQEAFVRVYEDAEPRTYKLKAGKKLRSETW